MTRLIDADALLEALLKTERLEPIEGFNGWDNQPDAEGCLVWFDSIFHLIYNAPTVQREGWKQVGEVEEAIRERDRLGFAVVNVIGRLDEIIMWNELQAELEYMPKRADLYTSPQPSEWVGLSEGIKNNLIAEYEKHKNYYLLVSEVEAACKQINTKG